VSPLAAAGVEALGTAVLVFMIFALTDRRNGAGPGALAPFLIGFTVAVLISVFAPITQAGWNPARDLGPRLVAFAAGWGEVAIPGPRNGFWVYIVGPLLGAPIGALLHDRVVRRTAD
jgi:glycerol uptake facilitator-like aquaporin